MRTRSMCGLPFPLRHPDNPYYQLIVYSVFWAYWRIIQWKFGRFRRYARQNTRGTVGMFGVCGPLSARKWAEFPL